MKKLLTKINLLLLAFCAEARRFLRDNVEPVVQALKIVKDSLNNPAVDFIAGITPTQWDNIALIHMRQWLPIAIASLELPVLISKQQTIEQMLGALVSYLNGLPKPLQNATIAKLATILAQLKAGGTNLRESEIDLLVHLAVQRLKHGSKE